MFLEDIIKILPSNITLCYVEVCETIVSGYCRSYCLGWICTLKAHLIIIRRLLHLSVEPDGSTVQSGTVFILPEVNASRGILVTSAQFYFDVGFISASNLTRRLFIVREIRTFSPLAVSYPASRDVSGNRDIANLSRQLSSHVVHTWPCDLLLTRHACWAIGMAADDVAFRAKQEIVAHMGCPVVGPWTSLLDLGFWSWSSIKCFSSRGGTNLQGSCRLLLILLPTKVSSSFQMLAPFQGCS